VNDSVKPSPQAREDALFALAIEMPAAERAAFLQAVCGSDNALRQRLEVLLTAHDRTGGWLEEGGDERGVRAILKSEVIATGADEYVGQAIGRYKLLEKVGEGGCGVVYVAEQTEPVRRRVALKVIKLGMDTRQVVARFEAERQALAMMDHPNIAKVLDAGTTEMGRPFFVMELVRGIRITDYCDQANLTTKERLDLFIKVCQAIQHAHQKGIIHRDIKPSNILVTLHDGVPVPKVIDFGIAKATEGRLTDATVYTQLHQFIGTPAYMSPEQAEMSGLDIDTRSDIYSLGVLLYELLAGSTPFDGKELLALGIDHMRRVIREKEPLRPSTRLATLKGDELTTTAKRRSADTSKLLHQLQGDLDWIVMKCLEKDRNRRYDTANGLATDLKRHLNNEPVTARPPSAAYRFQKAWHRNKLAYSAAVALGLAILAGAILSSVQAVRARKAETLAKARLTETEQARAEAEQVAQFLQQVFESPDPERDGRTTTVAESLDRAAKKLDADLADQPERRARLQSTLAKTYTALGLHAPALKLSEQVHAFWVGKLGAEAPETLDAAGALVRSLWANGQSREALPLTEDLLERTRRRYGPDHTNTLSLVLHYANVLGEVGRRFEALKLREENLDAHRRVLGPEHRETLVTMQNLEVNYHQLGMTNKSRPLQEEIVELSLKILGPDHPVTWHQLGNLAVDYTTTGRHAEAIELLVEVLSKQRSVLGPEHPGTIQTMQTLGDAYHRSGRTNEALQLREEVLELTRKSQGAEHPHVIYRIRVLANSYRAVGRTNEAIQLQEDTLALARKIHGEEHPDFLGILEWLAYSHFQMNNLEEAIRLGEECVSRSRKAIDTNSFAFIQRVTWLGNYYARANRHEQSLPLRRELVILTRLASGPEHTATVAAIKAVADLYAEQGRWLEAREELNALMEMQRMPGESASTIALMGLAALDVLLADQPAYEAHCKVMLAQFGAAMDSETANRIAKACLLMPLDGGNRQPAIALAARGVRLGENSPALPWYLLAQALAQSRSGNWTDAADSAERALDLSREWPNAALSAALRATLAMARHRLGKVADARQALAEAAKLFEENWPRVNEGKLGAGWHDVLIAQILLHEARTLIEPKAGETTP